MCPRSPWAPRWHRGLAQRLGRQKLGHRRCYPFLEPRLDSMACRSSSWDRNSGHKSFWESVGLCLTILGMLPLSKILGANEAGNIKYNRHHRTLPWTKGCLWLSNKLSKVFGWCFTLIHISYHFTLHQQRVQKLTAWLNLTQLDSASWQLDSYGTVWSLFCGLWRFLSPAPLCCDVFQAQTRDCLPWKISRLMTLGIHASRCVAKASQT